MTSADSTVPGSVAFHGADVPDLARIQKCVHCGFCLPTCPTYLLWGEEMDSPRGRIYLMKAGLDGRAAMTAPFVRHFDNCLGCLACVSACPSGVEYGPLIEKTRAQITQHHPRGFFDRAFRAMLLALVPYPGRMRLALAPLVVAGPLVRALAAALTPAATARPHDTPSAPAAIAGAVAIPAAAALPRPAAPGQPAGLLRRLGAMLALSPPATWRGLFARFPAHTPARGATRLKVAMLTGCVQRLSFRDVNLATARVLSAEGCDVAAPPGQGCCGALSLHSGEVAQARDLARHAIATFEAAGVDRIVVNAAGCGSAMKEYGELFRGDPEWEARARALSAKVRDVSEVLSDLGPARAPRHRIEARVAYHDACHLAHGQGIRAQPRAMLQAIPGLTVVSPAEADICCGSAGIYNLVRPEPAAQLGERKARHLAALSADMIAAANPGCILQIAAAGRRLGHQWPIVHPIELVDASIRGVDLWPSRGAGKPAATP
jgi:glycolate oxidase iron-sulfur subunit